MKKKIFTLIVGLLMTALGAAAPTGGNTGPLHWSYNAGTKTLTITGTGAMPDYTAYGDQPWVAFREQIKSVTIENGVTKIGSCAFFFCEALQSITFRASVTAIGDAAFYACTALQSIALPTSVTAIGDRAFYSCIKLQSIDLPARVTAIGESAFDNCTALRSITLPAGVIKIGKYAFVGCTALQQVTVAWDTPLRVPDNTFDGVNTANVTLKVPAGTEAAYRAADVWKEFKVGDTEPPVPGDGGKLTVSTTYWTFKVEWTKAADNESYDYDLKYTLFWKKASESVWKEVDMLNTTAYITTKAEANTEYVAYVRVKDEAGNYADYETKKFKTLPSPPPVPGDGGKLTISNITGSGFTVNWEKAADAQTPQNELIYKVYCKSGGFIIFQASDLVATLTDKTSYTIAGLGGSGGININPALDKGYDVNVEVVDKDGSSAWYKSENVKLAPATVAVTGVTVAPGELTLKVGHTGALTATVAPATATNKAVTWTSSDASVASVDGAGLVTIRKKGKATVTATANDGSGVSASCLFDVISTVGSETVDGLRVYAHGSALRLTLPKAETVHIYHVEGSLVKTLALPSGDHVQPLPAGVYVVRVGERVTKVMVK